MWTRACSRSSSSSASREQSFSDAVRQCVSEASRTIRGISGVKVVESTANVTDGQITEYHVTCRVAFPVERGGSAG